MLFVKGLEMYGKGWKKIAGLIKTRTVVQIRTHAQKYFLKLSKARQNGEHSSNHVRGPMDGFRRKKYKGSERPLALCPLLKSYFTRPESTVSLASSVQTDGDNSDNSSPGGSIIPSSNTNNLSTSSVASGNKTEGDDNVSDSGSTTTGSTEPPQAPSVATLGGNDSLLDTESGLYNFLSPVLAAEVPGAGTTLFNTSNMNEMTAVAGQVPPPPSWYKLGLTIQNLLTEAERIDWSNDMGQIVTGDVAATNTAFMGQPALFNAYMNKSQNILNGQQPPQAMQKSHSVPGSLELSGPVGSLSVSNANLATDLKQAPIIKNNIHEDSNEGLTGHSSSVSTFVDQNAPLSNTALYRASLDEIYPSGNGNSGHLKRTRMSEHGSASNSVDDSSFNDETSLGYLRWRSRQLVEK